MDPNFMISQNLQSVEKQFYRSKSFDQLRTFVRAKTVFSPEDITPAVV